MNQLFSMEKVGAVQDVAHAMLGQRKLAPDTGLQFGSQNLSKAAKFVFYIEESLSERYNATIQYLSALPTGTLFLTIEGS